jgi:hypothetical protein
MKQILRTVLTFLIVFIIGFTAGIAVNKYQHPDTGAANQLNADALSKK